LEFRYLQLHLVKKDWKKFIESDNPAAAALLCKMGYDEKERVQVRLEFLKMVSRMELDPAQMELLYGFFDTYLKLNDEEEKEVREEISHLPKEEADRVMELPNYYYDKGVEKGLEKVVYNMLKNGYSDEAICNITGLSVMKVKEMRKKQDD